MSASHTPDGPRAPGVVHVIQQLSPGGPTRALIATACPQRDRVVSLEPSAPASEAPLHQAGLTVIDAPGPERLEHELERADVVHVYFWNTPEMYALLAGPLPAMRVVLSCRVAGEYPPHVLTRELIEFADLTVATTPYTAELPVFRDAPASATAVIPSAGGWGRIRDVQSKPHHKFNIGYVGTVDFVKMHPRYVPMGARVNIPDARFIVCGSGDGFKVLARQAAALGVRDRFELRGFVEDVGSVFEQLDVFGYPLRADNYSASELVLQEAMYCGVPPVVLAHGGAQRSVVHGRTGLVAEDEDAYVGAIERLHANPEERRRMGGAAADHARAAWNVENLAARWSQTYARLAAEPKRSRSWPAVPESPAAWRAPAAARFVQTLGGRAPEFAISLTGHDTEELLQAEALIARCSPPLASADGGGVLHWRRRYPDDPWLRLWAGLVLHGQGRLALAIAEFNAAVRLGIDDWRALSYLARSAQGLGHQALVQRTLEAVPRDRASHAQQVLAGAL